MSPVKEPHYFSSDIDCSVIRENVEPDEYFSTLPLQKRHALCIRRPEHYEQLFAAAADAPAVGEASVSYLYSPVAPQRIAAEVADARILIFLRNPIVRAYSHFVMDQFCEVAASPDFLKAVELDLQAPQKGWGVSHLYIELGLYVPQVKRYLERFPPERVKICLHDDYARNLNGTLMDILSFLQVDGSLDNIAVDKKHYEAVARPIFSGINNLTETRPYRILRRALPQSVRAKAKSLLTRKPRAMRRDEFEGLIPYFREDILELSSLLRRDLSHWLVPPPNLLRA
jgi:hypothetical protein